MPTVPDQNLPPSGIKKYDQNNDYFVKIYRNIVTRLTPTEVNWPRIKSFHNLPWNFAGVQITMAVHHFLILTPSCFSIP